MRRYTMGIIENIKRDIAKSGTNKSKILYVKSDSKVRIRFLQELDTGYQFDFHDSYELGVNALCQEELGKDCPIHDDERLRTRPMYVWSVYNYDTQEVQLMVYAVNSFTPVNALMTMYENYETIMDRDYVIQKTGKGTNTAYTVIPQDKQKFRNTKLKPLAKSAILKILAAAYPLPDKYRGLDSEYDDAEINDEDIPHSKARKKAVSNKNKEEEDYYYNDDMLDDFDEMVGKKKKAKKTAKKAKPKKATEDAIVTESFIEKALERFDIDEDDFLEYYEFDSIDDFINNEFTKKEFKTSVKDYLEEIEDE